MMRRRLLLAATLPLAIAAPRAADALEAVRSRLAEVALLVRCVQAIQAAGRLPQPIAVVRPICARARSRRAVADGKALRLDADRHADRLESLDSQGHRLTRLMRVGAGAALDQPAVIGYADCRLDAVARAVLDRRQPSRPRRVASGAATQRCTACASIAAHHAGRRATCSRGTN